jgi:transposase-like protein
MSGMNDSKVESPTNVQTEVSAKARRRRYTVEYKARILQEADAAAGKPGAVGAMLRREGLYSSHLTMWREQRRRGNLGGRKRGPKPHVPHPAERQLAEQERELRQWKKRALRAEALVELQKKVSEVLGVTLPDPNAAEDR